MIQFRVYVDDEGRARAQVAPPYELLEWFLESEVGVDRLLVTRMIADIDRAATAEGEIVEGASAQGRWWFGETARLRYLQVDPPFEVDVPLMALRFILERWQALIAE